MKTIIRLEAGVVFGFIAAYVLGRATHSGTVVFVVWVLVGLAIWALLPILIPGLRRTTGKPIEVVEDGDWTVIKVTPAPLVMTRYVVIACVLGVLAAVLAGAETHSFVLTFTAGVLVATALVFMSETFQNNKRCAHLKTFAVRPDAIRLPNGTVVDNADMYRVVITNATDGTHVTDPFYTGTTMGTTMVAATSVVAASNLRAYGKVAFIVNLEHAGVRSPLAGGLTEPQAEAVFQEVRKRVKVFQPT